MREPERETAWKTKYDHTRGMGGGFWGRKWDYRGRLVAARTTVSFYCSNRHRFDGKGGVVGMNRMRVSITLHHREQETSIPDEKKVFRNYKKIKCIMQKEGSQSTPTGFEPHCARIWNCPALSCLKDKQNYYFMCKMAFLLCRNYFAWCGFTGYHR